MPFAHKVVRVTLSGQMFGGAEEWQTGFFVGALSADAAVPTQAYTDVVRDAWATFFTAQASDISSSYTFTQVKAARIATDGKYDGSDVAISYPATTKAGYYGGAPMPPQVALVATLIAGSGKGLAGKGRMYLPGVSIGIGGTGKINGGWCQATATRLAAFFNTIDSSFDAPGHVINASEGSAKLLGVNAKNVPVNGVRIGDVYDTQRRRRNALSETYYAATVAD